MAKRTRCLLCNGKVEAHDDVAKVTFPAVPGFKRYAHQRCLFEGHLVIMKRRGK